MVLAGSNHQNRESSYEVSNELVILNVDGGVDVDYGAGVGGGAAACVAAGAGQHEGATSCIRCCGFLCEKWGVKGIVSKNVRHACTPKAMRRKESFAKTMQNLKRKLFGEIPRAVMEKEVTEYKKLNIYRRPSVVEKEAVVKVTGAKDIQMESGMHVFTNQDFRNMTSRIVWWEDWRHSKYPDYYDPRDRILDLNFYMNFLHRYNQMSDKETMSGGKSMSQLLDDFAWDDDMIDYVRGIRPNPGGMDWIDAKRIL
ncbi:hypothetical protein EJD97_018337, partial [Solanum chilense]